MASFATQRLLTRSCPLLLVLRVALLVCLAVALATCPLLKELGPYFAPLPPDPPSCVQHAGAAGQTSLSRRDAKVSLSRSPRMHQGQSTLPRFPCPSGVFPRFCGGLIAGRTTRPCGPHAARTRLRFSLLPAEGDRARPRVRGVRPFRAGPGAGTGRRGAAASVCAGSDAGLGPRGVQGWPRAGWGGRSNDRLAVR